MHVMFYNSHSPPPPHYEALYTPPYTYLGPVLAPSPLRLMSFPPRMWVLLYRFKAIPDNHAKNTIALKMAFLVDSPRPSVAKIQLSNLRSNACALGKPKSRLHQKPLARAFFFSLTSHDGHARRRIRNE